ncbi:MAG: mechanosensitive ion channel family protein [Helicobacter sp.]|nr:mechanosensitive ion channel family protein [Helicobacter sp.]MDE7196085.1 mechanosensitive ion channel family protein [Helicobacter sp.]
MKCFLAIFLFFMALVPLNASMEYDFVPFFNLLRKLEALNQQEGDAQTAQKDALLAEIPESLDTKKDKLSLLQAALDKDKSKVKSALEKAKNSPTNTLRYQIQSAQIDAQTLMFDWLKRTLELRKQVHTQEQISTLIQSTLASLDSLYIEQYEAALFDIPAAQKAALEKRLNQLRNEIASYHEVLNYLNANSALLDDNSFFDSLGVETIINKINAWIPFSFWKFNLGKLIVCAIILAFFWCLRRILAVATVKIISSIFHYQESMDKRTVIIKNLVRPLSYILLFNGFDICWEIIYYPQNPPELVSKIFDISYIVSAAWFFVIIIEYYGTIFLTTFSRKHYQNVRAEIVNLILKVLYSIVVIIAALAILARMGFNITTLVASLGIGGLAVALATKDILANFFASVMILFDNAFSQGDWISCNKIEGTVVEIGLRRTTIRTFDNALLFVPNSVFVNDAICNWNRRKVGRRIKMTIGLTYDATADKLQKCIDDIIHMLENHKGIAKKSDYADASTLMTIRQELVSIDDYEGNKSTIEVYLDNFGDSTIDISVSCFTTAISKAAWVATKQSVLFEIMRIVQDNGLSFAFPSQSVYVENLPKDLQQLLLESPKTKEQDS